MIVDPSEYSASSRVEIDQIARDAELVERGVLQQPLAFLGDERACFRGPLADAVHQRRDHLGTIRPVASSDLLD